MTPLPSPVPGNLRTGREASCLGQGRDGRMPKVCLLPWARYGRGDAQGVSPALGKVGTGRCPGYASCLGHAVEGGWLSLVAPLPWRRTAGVAVAGNLCKPGGRRPSARLGARICQYAADFRRVVLIFLCRTHVIAQIMREKEEKRMKRCYCK